MRRKGQCFGRGVRGAIGLMSSVFVMLLVLAASAEVQLTYYLAAKRHPITGEPAPAHGVPEGEEWISGTYTTPAGVDTPIMRKRNPEFSLTEHSIVGVEIYRSLLDAVLFPSSMTVATRLIVDRKVATNRFGPISKYQGEYWLVVESEGRLIDMAPIGVNISENVPGGVFRSEEEARRFYVSFGDRLRVKEHSAIDKEAARAAFESSTKAVLWYLKCDDDFRAATSREDEEGVAALMDAYSDFITTIDCSSEPPLI